MRLHVLADDKPLANGTNPAILDEQVGLIIVHSRDNASILDQDCCHRLPPRIGCRTIVSPVCDTLPFLQRPAQAGVSHAGLVPALMRVASLCCGSLSCSRMLRSPHAPQPSPNAGSGAVRAPTIGATQDVILRSVLDRAGSRVYAQGRGDD